MDAKLASALNTQIKEEMNSAYIYAAMAADMESKNWKGVSSWFKKQATEEMEHAMKIYGYLNERGEKVVFEALDKPKDSYGSILEVFEAALKHEKYISGCIHKLVGLSREVGDLPTETFLQWFITEQVEEEARPTEIVERLKMVGDAPHIMFMLDRELGSRE